MILLHILDEGSFTDSQGRKVNFKNTIICLTSNLGSDVLAHASGVCILPKQRCHTEVRDEVLERTSEHFLPGLLNLTLRLIWIGPVACHRRGQRAQ